MVLIGACKNSLTPPIIFEPGETLPHKDYIEIILRHAQSEGTRLIDNDFINQK
jgi:hypothetical protein